ncbi:hypothetical protein N8987_03755 [Crocinitomix sp.]|nr:hypothetical protein [Crocinitomix sp.]
MTIQEITVYGLFLTAIVYFAYRFYRKNIKKKSLADSNGKSCSSGSCGCA